MSGGRAQTIGELEAPEQLYKRDSVLFAAASRGQTELIRSLIARGEHVDWADAHGQTPLWAAAWNGHADACAALCEAGADVNAATRSGLTPLMQAVLCKRTDCVRVLLEHRADTSRVHPGAHPLCAPPPRRRPAASEPICSQATATT